MIHMLPYRLNLASLCCKWLRVVQIEVFHLDEQMCILRV